MEAADDMESLLGTLMDRSHVFIVYNESMKLLTCSPWMEVEVVFSPVGDVFGVLMCDQYPTV